MLDKLKKEAVNLLLLFLVFMIIFRIIYLKEGIITITRTVLSIFWLFILPGFCLMYYWHENLDFVERLVIGVGVSAAITGILSYYFGLMGLNVRYHGFIFPLVMLGFALFLIIKAKNKSSKDE